MIWSIIYSRCPIPPIPSMHLSLLVGNYPLSILQAKDKLSSLIYSRPKSLSYTLTGNTIASGTSALTELLSSSTYNVALLHPLSTLPPCTTVLPVSSTSSPYTLPGRSHPQPLPPRLMMPKHCAPSPAARRKVIGSVAWGECRAQGEPSGS